MLPEAQAHESFVTGARRRQCCARAHSDLLTASIDRVAGIHNDATAVRFGRGLDVNAESAHDSEAVQHAIMAPEFLAMIVLLGLQRSGVQKLPGKEVRPRQGRAY